VVERELSESEEELSDEEVENELKELDKQAENELKELKESPLFSADFIPNSFTKEDLENIEEEYKNFEMAFEAP